MDKEITDIEEQEAVVPMEDTIRETLAEINARGDEAEAGEEAPEATGRDDKGRFAKQDEPVVEAEAAPVEEAPAAAEQAYDQAPSRWKSTSKAKWGTVDPEVRDEILRAENDHHKQIHQILPDAQYGRALRNEIEPLREWARAQGVDIDAGAMDAVRTAKALWTAPTVEQKQAILLQVARAHNIPLPGADQSQQVQQPYMDPRVDAIVNRLAQDEQRQAQEKTTRMQSSVQNWTNEAKDGKPLRPYVEQVEHEMLALIDVLGPSNPQWAPEKLLQECYERAVRANPAVWATVSAEQQAQAEAKRREENLRKVANAKKAGSGHLPKRGGLPTQEPVGQMEDTIRAKYRELTG